MSRYCFRIFILFSIDLHDNLFHKSAEKMDIFSFLGLIRLCIIFLTNTHLLHKKNL